MPEKNKETINIKLIPSSVVFMSIIYNWFKKITDAIPVLLRRIGAILIFFAVLGTALGYFIALNQLSPLWLIGLPISMVAMWNDLDQGFLVLVLFLVALFTFPF
ncbi:MAG: hypothetical protein ABIA76_05450 [Candidatus Diapherotrites archaeon]